MSEEGEIASFTEINLKDKKKHKGKYEPLPLGLGAAQESDFDGETPPPAALFARPLDLGTGTSDVDTSFEDKETPWFKDIPTLVATFLTAFWVFVAVQYFVRTGWWDNRFATSPAEFVGFISGMFLPIVIIWLLIAYLKRTARFERESRAFRAYMSQLIYPTNEGAAYTKSLTEALKAEVSDLRQTFETINNASLIISSELQARISEMQKLAAKIDGEILFSIKDLTGNVEKLLSSADSASVRAKEASALLSDQVITLNEASEEAGARVTGFGESLKSSISGIDELSGKIEEKGNLITNTVALLEKKISAVNENTEEMVKASVIMAEDLSAKTSELTELFRSHENELAIRTEAVSAEAASLATSFKKQGTIISDEGSRISERLKLLSEDITVKASEVFTLADNSFARIGDVAELIKTNTALVSSASQKASNDMLEVAGALDKTFASVAASADSVTDKTAAFVEEVKMKCGQIGEVTDTVCANIAAVAETAAGNTLALKQTIEGVAEGFDALITTVKSESGKLEELSAIVVAQSRLAESSLAEQQRHISASAARIEEVKGELRKEVEELTGAASFIDENTASAISKLHSNMEELISIADSVISRTDEVSEAIAKGTATLDTSSNAALATVTKVATVLKAEGDSMENMSSMLEKQAGILENMTIAAETKIGTLTEGFEARAEYLADLLSKAEAFIEGKSKKMLGNIDAARELIQKHSELIDADMDKIAAKVSKIEKGFDSQFNLITGAYDEVLAKIDKAVAMVKESEAEFNEIGDRTSIKAAKVLEHIGSLSKNAIDRTEAISTIMEQISSEIETLASKSSDKIEDAALKIRRIFGEVSEGTGAATEEVLAAGEAFIRRAEMITKASDTAAQKLKVLISELK